MSEWLKVLVLKTNVQCTRGFESLSVRKLSFFDYESRDLNPYPIFKDNHLKVARLPFRQIRLRSFFKLLSFFEQRGYQNLLIRVFLSSLHEDTFLQSSRLTRLWTVQSGRIRTSEMSGSKPDALPLGDTLGKPKELVSIFALLEMTLRKSTC